VSTLERSVPVVTLSGASPASDPLTTRVRAYWNVSLHDRHASLAPVGTTEFFRDLDAFRFAKLNYLAERVNFAGYRDRCVLEVGCGAGVDLLRFARGGARVIGVEVAENALGLARANFEAAGQTARWIHADGGDLPIPSASVDLVYCHGVLQYAAEPERIVAEARRVLRPGGEAVFMAYNRCSWMAWMSRTMNTPLEHQDAPVFRLYSATELDRLLAPFEERRVVPERFPQRTRMKRGWKAALFNHLLVPVVSLLPRPLIRPYGWHLMAYCRAGPSAAGSR
jgi:SAM-dependent methyltransferase